MKLFYTLVFLAGLTTANPIPAQANEAADEINDLPTANLDSIRIGAEGNYSAENPQKATRCYFAPGIAMDEFSKTSDSSNGPSNTEEGIHK